MLGRGLPERALFYALLLYKPLRMRRRVPLRRALLATRFLSGGILRILPEGECEAGQ